MRPPAEWRRTEGCARSGSANCVNNVAVLIPCHRVIRSDGTLGGYGGGLDRKRQLLEAEGCQSSAPELPLSN